VREGPCCEEFVSSYERMHPLVPPASLRDAGQNNILKLNRGKKGEKTEAGQLTLLLHFSVVYRCTYPHTAHSVPVHIPTHSTQCTGAHTHTLHIVYRCTYPHTAHSVPVHTHRALHSSTFHLNPKPPNYPTT